MTEVGHKMIQLLLNKTTPPFCIEKYVICQRDYRLQSFLSIQYVHGDLFKHSDRYSNLFLNAYINRHVHAQYLKMI